MLKQLRAVCTLILLASISLLPMEKEAADIDEFAQAKEFHEMLVRNNDIRDGMRSFYKKINPITSRVTDEDNKWRVTTVSIGNNKMHGNATGFYTDGEISFTYDPEKDCSFIRPCNILVTYGEENSEIKFHNNGYILRASPRFNCYADVLHSVHNNDLFSLDKKTLTGQLNILGRNPCWIKIECEKEDEPSITLHGMEVVYSRDERKTYIFFDFIFDPFCSGPSAHSIECNHSEIKVDNKIFSSKDQTMHENNNKKIYGLFNSIEIRKNWIFNELDFYDLDNNVRTSLPSCYDDFNEYQATFQGSHIVTVKDKRSSHKKINVEVNDHILLAMDTAINQIPDEVWELIFLNQNEWHPLELSKQHWQDNKKAEEQWYAMRRIVQTSLVCKRFNRIAQKLLPIYTKEIKTYINREFKDKDRAAYIAYTTDYNWGYPIMEICKGMKANLNTTEYTEMRGETLLTQTILKHKTWQTSHLLEKGADPKKRNRKGDMPIDLAYANGLFEAARLIKDNGGDPEDKYEYRDGNFVCKQGQGGRAYAPQQADDFPVPNNPPPIPDPQTSVLPSWINGSSSCIFLAGISVSAVVYWLYTKYRAVDEDKEEENDYSKTEVESKEDCSQAIPA